MPRCNEPYLEPGEELPPAYIYGSSAVNTPDSLDACLSQRIQCCGPVRNYINILQTEDSIRGAYTIDPSLPPSPSTPPQAMRPPNLRFSTESGAIEAVITLVQAPCIREPTLLDIKSQTGPIALTIKDDMCQRFHLHAVSDNGSVSLRVPRTFCGPISTHGCRVFSPDVQAVLRIFSDDTHDGKFFIGKYEESAFPEDLAVWEGDAVSVDARNGNIRIAWADCLEEHKGFFKRYF